MTNRLMISVAALALLAGTGLANAQGMGHEAPAAAPAQAAPAEHGAAPEHGAPGAQMKNDAARPAVKSTQNEPKSPGMAPNQRAEESTQGPKSKTLSTENADKAGARENTTGQNMKPENRAEDNEMNKAGRIDQKMSNESEGRSGRRDETVGQAGAGAKLTTEQRTKITTVIRDQHVTPMEHVNFSISVGTRVPRDVHFYPLPAEVITYYPEWRGYEFIQVGDQVVVVDPRSFEIVAVLDV